MRVDVSAASSEALDLFERCGAHSWAGGGSTGWAVSWDDGTKMVAEDTTTRGRAAVIVNGVVYPLQDPVTVWDKDMRAQLERELRKKIASIKAPFRSLLSQQVRSEGWQFFSYMNRYWDANLFLASRADQKLRVIAEGDEWSVYLDTEEGTYVRKLALTVRSIRELSAFLDSPTGPAEPW